MYLGAELHQQFGSIRTVGGQAAHCSAEIGQAGYGFAGLSNSTGPFSMAGAGCGTGRKTSTTCCCQTHQSDQGPDVGQAQRFQTSCKAAAGTTEEGMVGERKGQIKVH